MGAFWSRLLLLLENERAFYTPFLFFAIRVKSRVSL